MKEINAPSAAVATIMAGMGSVFSYLPDAFAIVSTFLGSLLALQLLRNQRSIARKLQLERSILEIQLKEETDGHN